MSDERNAVPALEKEKQERQECDEKKEPITLGPGVLLVLDARQ